MEKFEAEYIATKETLEWGDIVISNNGNRYTFIQAVAENKVQVWDGENRVYRVFYARSVFGMRTRKVN